MKKVKIAFWGLILVFAGVFFYQNKVFFMARQGLSLKLPFLKALNVPELPHAVLFLIFFLTGFLIAYFTSLYDRFRAKKTIKTLNAATTSQLEELAALKREMEAMKRGPAGGTVPESPVTDSEDTP